MRRFILILAVLLLCAALGFVWFTRPLPVLTVTSWAGSYGRAQAAALMRPYASAKRVDVHIAEYDGGLSELSKAVATHQYHGDVIDFELPDAIEACHRGLLEPIDAASVAAGTDGTPAAKDFVAGAIGPCWVGSVVYSQAIIFAPQPGGTPARIQDFFDLTRFPGARALYGGSAKLNLELALLGDGVAPEQIYATLATEPGLARAFAKLESLKPHLIWWHTGREALDLVRSGTARFATARSGDIYEAARKDFSPGIIWDRQLYEFEVFGIPKDNPNRDRALDFIRFATGSAPLAGVADWVAYGPARRSSLALVGRNPELHIEMRPWLPTAHFATAFAVDDEWWRVHGAAIEARWQNWLAASESH